MDAQSVKGADTVGSDSRGYDAGKKVKQHCRILPAIVRKPEGQRTFEVLPRRWAVERTLAWLYRWRRLDRDYERLPEHSEALIK